jgi:hypothetical protein
LYESESSANKIKRTTNSYIEIHISASNPFKLKNILQIRSNDTLGTYEKNWADLGRFIHKIQHAYTNKTTGSNRSSLYRPRSGEHRIDLAKIY